MISETIYPDATPEPSAWADDRQATAEREAAALNARLRDAAPEDVLRAVLAAYPGRVALLSSFGAEAALSLDLLARVAPETPVLFLDTRMHFAQTLDYRRDLTARLGLTDVRDLAPAAVDPRDPANDLWRRDVDACCALRKVEPLAALLPQFDVLITGRKRFHGAGRLRLPLFEALDGVIRLNILADADPATLDARFAERGLPRHPLQAAGFASIGCWPCTRPAREGDDTVRSGRWADAEKTECGIHLPRSAVAAPTAV
jgi:phosphoadenosine phosphosulfate reductase